MKRKLLFAMLCIASALGLKAQQQPEAGQTYYLYNPTTGLFLSRGAGYGTAAWADNFGIPVTLIANDNGYRLQYSDTDHHKNVHFVSDATWSWADGWADRAQTYTLTELGDNQYKLVSTSHTDDKTLYISETAANTAYTHQVASDGAYGNNCNEYWDVWQFLSSEDREAILADKKEKIEKAVAQAVEVSLSEGKNIESALAEKSLMPVDKTSAVTNAALASNTDGWTSSNTTGNFAGQQGNGVEMYQGSGVLSQTVKGLEAGVYKVSLSAFFRDGSNANCSAYSNNGWRVSNAYLEANGNQTMIADWASARSSDSAPNGPAAAKPLFNEGKYLNEVFAVVGEDGNLTINIAQPGAAVESRWFLFTNLKLTYYTSNLANADDYAAFNKALAAAKEHTLGFEAGEYAPYNNVEAEKALAEAEKIDVTVANEKEVIVTLTEALNNSVWVANEEEVNAVYNGNFALSTANTTSGSNLDVPGWTPNGSIRQVIENGVNGEFPGLAETTGNKALFVWGDTFFNYGEQEGYIMPLKGHAIYELSFKSAGWNGGNNSFGVKIVGEDGKGLPQQAVGKAPAGPQSAGCWIQYTILFATGEAGNFVLSMMPSGNSTFTDIVLKKAESQVLVLDEETGAPRYAEGNYPTVSLTRTFTEGNWSTLCLPFGVDASKFSAVKELSDITVNGENVTLNFTDATELKAGKPYLVQASGETTISAENVDVIIAAGSTAKESDHTTVTYVGTYAPISKVNEGSFVVSNNKLYNVNSEVSLKAYRGYFTAVQTTGAVKNLTWDMDDTADGIESVEAKTIANDAIYNLAGQRVSKAAKGVYIINGKKVLK